MGRQRGRCDRPGRRAGWLALTAVLACSAGAAPASAATPIGATVGGDRLASSGVVVDAPGAAALPDLRASAYLLADLTTGDVLAGKDPHGRWRPASTQKVLTALTLLPRLDRDAVYTARFEDADVEGSKAGIVPDATYPVHSLFQALFLVSGNDAANALANAAGGVPQTVAAMSETARALGARDTTVRNPSGLDAPGQLTSAYDLAVIARAAMTRPDFREYVTTVKAQFPGKMPKPGKVRKTFEIYTQDRLLLTYRGAIGVKTGWTSKARGTFVGAATRGGRTLVATVLHSRGDGWRDAAALLTWGFRNGALARPVGTLEAVPDAAPAGSSAADVAPDGEAASGPVQTDGGMPRWLIVPVVLLGAVVLLRIRVLLRRRSRRGRLTLPPVPRARTRGRARRMPSGVAGPVTTSTPRTVRVLDGDPPPAASAAGSAGPGV